MAQVRDYTRAHHSPLSPTLLPDFYHINSLSHLPDGSFTASVTLNPAHPVYAGHFPGCPVVPGVCTFNIVKECCAAALGKTLATHAIASCKFTDIIRPGITGTLTISATLSPAAADGTIACRAQVSAGDTVYLKLKATFTAS